jgi:hypothetical protein
VLKMACRSRSKLDTKTSETVLFDGMMAISFGQFATYEVLRCGFGEVLPTENGRRLFHYGTKKKGVRTTIVLMNLSLRWWPRRRRWTTRQHASRVGAHRHAAACLLQTCETGEGILEYAAISHPGKQVVTRLTARLR